MTDSTPRRRSGRPIKPATPGQRVQLNTLVSPQTKEWLVARSIENARSLGQQADACFELCRDLETKSSGPRSQHLFLSVTQIPRVLFDNESDWLDNRQNWDLVMHLLSEAFDARAPAPLALDRQEQIAAARGVVDEFRRTTDRRRREQLLQVLLSMSIDARLPQHVRLECMGAAVLPDPDEISLDDKIAAGRRVADQLRMTADPARRSHLQEVLAGLSKYDPFPEEVRAEFAEASVSSIVPLPPSSPPAGLVPEETRPRAVHVFDNAWALARLAALKDATEEPDEAAIATAFVADETLFTIAEMDAVPRDLGWVLAYRVWIEEERRKALGEPGGEAAASQPTAARRRRAATRRKV